MQQSEASVSSLRQAISRGYSFCVEPGVVGELVTHYPDINQLLRMTGTINQLDIMDAGGCDAAIVTEFAWYMARVNSTRHCDSKLRLRESILIVPVGVPIAQAISKQVASSTAFHRLPSPSLIIISPQSGHAPARRRKDVIPAARSRRKGQPPASPLRRFLFLRLLSCLLIPPLLPTLLSSLPSSPPHPPLKGQLHFQRMRRGAGFGLSRRHSVRAKHSPARRAFFSRLLPWPLARAHDPYAQPLLLSGLGSRR